MHTIPEAIEAIKRGEMVILTDDENRENEGDLVLAAQKITPEAINFMATHGRGLICLPMEGALIDQLALPPMTARNESLYGTAFTISIEARKGVTTGISAADRAHTILTAVSENALPQDVISPGHVFPLRAVQGGVLVRGGQTEGSVDLARLAGLRPAAVVCEIMNPDGTMARMPELKKFVKKHCLNLVSIQALIAYRLQHEVLVEKCGEAKLPTKETGNFKVIGFRSLIDNTEHLALVKGNLKDTPAPLVRVHSECLTGDALNSIRCDCGFQLRTALAQMHEAGCGVLVYLRAHEGRGIGLLNKIQAYSLQDKGFDTVEANEHLGFKPDLRHYGIGAQILKQLGLNQVRLLTNNPQKISGLDDTGLEIVQRVSLEIPANKTNISYLRTKRDKLGHFLKVDLL